MATHVVSKGSIYRIVVVLKTTTKFYFCRMWCGISYFQNLYSIPNPIPLHDTISIRKALKIVYFHTDTKSSGMDTVLNRHTTPTFRQPPEDTSSTFLWNFAHQNKCYFNIDNIMFLQHCGNLKWRTSKCKWRKCAWFMLGKLNDKYHIIFFTNTIFNAALLCTTSVLQFLSLPQMKQERKEIYSKTCLKRTLY